MALAAASGSRSSALASSSRARHQKPGTSRRVSAANRLPCVASAAAASPDMSAAASNSTNSSKYAILRLGGVRQMLQEGLLYTCPKHCLLQEQQQPHEQHPSTAAGNGAAPGAGQRSFVLDRVLGLHNGQQFMWGSPYVPNTLVEVEVLEEFEGPKPKPFAGAAAAAAGATPSAVDESMMTIYRVTHIKAAQ